MTLQTSFFNKGIYKSTIKRYAWGACLYFLILFMFTAMSIFLNVDMDNAWRAGYSFSENPLILDGSYIVIPLLLAIVVPTIVAALVFRFLHSKKQAIFTHSLPVTRGANYISSIAAAFTLMYAPIILNTLILMLLSLGDYGECFTVIDCLKWGLYNIYAIFLMFSCAAIAASLTANSAAMIGINILIHASLLIIVSSIEIMAQIFLWGYTSSNIIMDAISENNFVTVAFGLGQRYFRNKLSLISNIEYIGATLIFYVSSYFLYRARKIENTGDIAGFKCLNTVFKYFVCFLTTMLGFSIFASYMQENPIAFALILVIVSAVSYIAAEMLLKKTLNVLYSWKGYALYALCFCLLFGFFYETSLFGYETRVPQKEDIAKASIYNYYYADDEPFTADNEIISAILAHHEKLVDKPSIPKLSDYSYYRPDKTNIHIKYKLKNGFLMERSYIINVSDCYKILDEMYEYDEYKKLIEYIFTEDSKITNVSINNSDTEFEDKKTLINLLREDTLDLKYSQLHLTHGETNERYYYVVNVQYRYRVKTNDNDFEDYETHLRSFDIGVTQDYKRAYQYLSEKGYATVESMDAYGKYHYID